MDTESPQNFSIEEYTNYVPNQLKINLSYEEKKGDEIIQNIPYDEPVKTISTHWLPIETLRDEYKHNQRYVENIEKLSDTYCAWRKVRGDGNCYYRSVISIYMLHIFHFNDDQQRVLRLLGILRSIQSSEDLKKNHNIDGEYKTALDYIIQVINKLYIDRNANSMKNFVIMSHLLQDIEFDLMLIRVSRLLSYMVFNGPKGEQIKPFLDESEVEGTMERILRMGTEAEGVELSLCPLALDIIINQVNVFDDLLFNTFPLEQENDRNNEAKFHIHIICKSRGHYDSLYSIKDMENEDYCISENKYMIDKSVTFSKEGVLEEFYKNLHSNPIS